MAQQLTQQGFIVWDVSPKRWMENVRSILELLKNRQIRNYETVVDGFEKTPEVFKSLIKGEYKGRVVVKV